MTLGRARSRAGAKSSSRRRRADHPDASPYLVDVLRLASVSAAGARSTATSWRAEFALVTVRWTRVERAGAEENSFGAPRGAARGREPRRRDRRRAARHHLREPGAGLDRRAGARAPAASRCSTRLPGAWGGRAHARHRGRGRVPAASPTCTSCWASRRPRRSRSSAPRTSRCSWPARCSPSAARSARSSARSRGSSNVVVRACGCRRPRPRQDGALGRRAAHAGRGDREAGVHPPRTRRATCSNVFRLLGQARCATSWCRASKVVTLSHRRLRGGGARDRARDRPHPHAGVGGDPDNIVGIVNTKDLFHLFSLKGS